MRNYMQYVIIIYHGQNNECGQHTVAVNKSLRSIFHPTIVGQCISLLKMIAERNRHEVNDRSDGR